RGDRHRVDRGAEIVLEAGQRQLSRASAAAKSRLSFEDDDRAALLGNCDRRGQAVGARADDEGVVGAGRECEQEKSGVEGRRSKVEGQHGGGGIVQSTWRMKSGRMGQLTAVFCFAKHSYPGVAHSVAQSPFAV